MSPLELYEFHAFGGAVWGAGLDVARSLGHIESRGTSRRNKRERDDDDGL